MAQRCDSCGKGPQAGNKVSHANNKTRRRWMPNLHNVRTEVKGVITSLKLCTRCIRSEKVRKVPSVVKKTSTSKATQATA